MTDHEPSNPLYKIIDKRFKRVVWPLKSEDDFQEVLSYIADYASANDTPQSLRQDRSVPIDPKEAEGEVDVDDVVSNLSIGIQRVAKIISTFMHNLGSISIVTEPNHIDAAYRDSYYNSYARHLAGGTRFTLRLNFFEGALDDDSFYRETDELLQERYLGSTTIYPIYGGLVGKTFIKPSSLITRPVRLRTAPFRADVYGRSFTVEAFPYRMQDADIMSCAETTILNLLDYYAASYDGYASALPSELIELEDQNIDDRTLPARGITYTTLSQVLGKCKFYPRLLSKYAFSADGTDLEKREENTQKDIQGSSFSDCYINMDEYFIRRSVYWYLSSGIPVAINVGPDQTKNPNSVPKGHSLIAAGLSELDNKVCAEIRPHLIDPSKKFDKSTSEAAASSITRLNMGSQTIRSENGNGRRCRIYLEADITRDLVLIDDSQKPYAIHPFECMTKDNHQTCENIVIPLHQSMALDAQGAFEASMTIFKDGSLGVLKWADGFLRENEGIILRMSLLTAARYRRFRRNTSDFPLDRLYETIALPHFVWLAELIRVEDYNAGDSTAFAELVLDATAGGRRETTGKIVIMRYPGRIVWNEPDDMPMKSPEPSYGWNVEQLPSFSTFPAYYDSLKEIKPDGNQVSGAHTTPDNTAQT